MVDSDNNMLLGKAYIENQSAVSCEVLSEDNSVKKPANKQHKGFQNFGNKNKSKGKSSD